jgi:hypothetical protein
VCGRGNLRDMSHELICSWLGLSTESWPPDHYRLLGLDPGEVDTALIEQRVHQRIDSVRCYQMRYPEQATEAMRLLARAFDCLTDPAGKKAYDASLGGVSAVATAAPPSRAVLEARDPLAWLYDPPPLRGGAAGLPAGIAGSADPTLISAPTIEMPPLPQDTPPAPPSSPEVVAAVEPSDPVLAAASSAPARRRLNTKRGLYSRIVLTRNLIRTWQQVGKYLSSPKRRLNRPSEATDLIHLLDDIQDYLRRFPPLMGEAGQPGYLVVTLSQLVIVPTFQTMDLKARKALSEDWRRGLKLLTAHRDFLRQEIRVMRRRALSTQLARAFSALPSDWPVLFALLLLALAAINLTYWHDEIWSFFRGH